MARISRVAAGIGVQGSPWLTAAEAAMYLRLASVAELMELVVSGELRPDGRVGTSGGYLFRPATLERFVVVSLPGNGQALEGRARKASGQDVVQGVVAPLPVPVQPPVVVGQQTPAARERAARRKAAETKALRGRLLGALGVEKVNLDLR